MPRRARSSAGRLALGAGFLAALGLLAAGACGSPTEAKFTPLPGWSGDLAAGRQGAAGEGRPLAVLFSSPWSSCAREFENHALADPEIQLRLKRYVRVRLDLDQCLLAAKQPADDPKTDQRARLEGLLAIEVLTDPKTGQAPDRPGVPQLVFISPLGEKRILAGACSARELAAVLAFLRTKWKTLDGWEADAAAAERLAAGSGKPLVTLYSAAWSPEAAVFEREVLLTDKKVRARLAEFTLLRLNFAAAAPRAAADRVKPEAVPALVVPKREGGKAVLTAPALNTAEDLLRALEDPLGVPKGPEKRP